MDFRVKTELFDHPKFRRLVSVAGNDGQAWLFRLWRYATIYFPEDGVFRGMSTDGIRDVLRSVYDSNTALDPIDVLREYGWLDIDTDGTVSAHDWEDHQPWVCGRKTRSEAARKAVNSRYNNKITKPTARIRPVESAYTERTANVSTPSPSPIPSPTPIVNKRGAADAAIPYAEIISHLNEKTRQEYRPTSKATQDKIRARWNEGWRLDDFLQVNSIKATEWLGTDMAKFLRPETLYGPKFESYLNQKNAPLPAKARTQQERDDDAVINSMRRSIARNGKPEGTSGGFTRIGDVIK